MQKLNSLVYTIPDLCRVCYTCVRECPVKAIRINEGQAVVIPERCIACGNCTRVCRQGAKQYRESIDRASLLLQSQSRTVALVAPSFVAEFEELHDYRSLVGMLRALGFSAVHEVAFGADLVAREYENLFRHEDKKGYISSDCPAIVTYIEKYEPELLGDLAPIVSPMLAMVRYLRRKYDESVKFIFIGPCIAKKDESLEVDAVITFSELRNMFRAKRIRQTNVDPSEFDPPLAMRGAGFPISRGLVQALDIDQSHLDHSVIVAEGRVNFQEAIREYKTGTLGSMHLELLCCDGCTMGPGTSRDGKKFLRRAIVLNYLHHRMQTADLAAWERAMDEGLELELTASFRGDDQRLPDPSHSEIRKVLQAMGKYTPQDHLDCGACGYDTCRNHAIAIIKGLAEIEMCLPYSIDQLHNNINKLAVSNDKLQSMQQALKQTEKLAHMGQLSAGIAHELNNPLGVVIMYSNILLEECAPDAPEREDLKLIAEQAERCKNIVGGLLNFARKNQVNHREVDLNELVRISLSSIIIPAGIEKKVLNRLNNPFAEIDQEQMVQVLSNLMRNSVEAMPGGGILEVTLKDDADNIRILVRDTGTGIREEDLHKVFEPFFTTKGIGKGTGLGLATAYGVVKMHKGKIEVSSNSDPGKGETGTTFTISLPRRRPL